MRKTFKRKKKEQVDRPVLQPHPKYADQKLDIPVVLVRPRNPEHWARDPRLKGVSRVQNDIVSLQRQEVRDLLIANADMMTSFRVTVGKRL